MNQMTRDTIQRLDRRELQELLERFQVTVLSTDSEDGLRAVLHAKVVDGTVPEFSVLNLAC